MRTRHAMLMVLVLALAFVTGCGSQDDTSGPPKKTSLEQATEDIVGGTWESVDESGDALNFRPNGTGQSYLAETGVTAEINWRMTAEDGQLILTWGYIETRAEDEKVWVIEFADDTMHVWPLSGSRILKDPETDDPFVLQRFE